MRVFKSGVLEDGFSFGLVPWEGLSIVVGATSHRGDLSDETTHVRSLRIGEWFIALAHWDKDDPR